MSDYVDQGLDGVCCYIDNILIVSPLLSHQLSDIPLRISCGGSDDSIDGVLEQHFSCSWLLLSLFPRSLTPPKRHYSTFYCELFTSYCAVCDFQPPVEERYFHLCMDHSPLFWRGILFLTLGHLIRLILRVPLYVSDLHFSQVHADIVGPLTVAHGFSYAVSGDRSTRWPDVFPLSSMSEAD